jgi:mannosyltransferase OCH1-like enzyme
VTDAVQEVVKRSDLFRVFAIFVFGGVYVDLDMCARGADFSDILLQHSSSVAWEPRYIFPLNV